MSAQNPHFSKEYDQMLEEVRGQVLQMGARVSRQLADAIECLSTGSTVLIDQVLRHEAVINALERSIDEAASQVIARRQPAAGDLRLLTTLLKSTTDLERIGDEAKKIALQARKLMLDGRTALPRYVEIRRMAGMGREMLRSALEALERLEADGAARVMRRDEELNEAFRAVLRQLISFMIEDPRTITACLDVVFMAKSLERVGDHAKNISEYVVYASKGQDVRHATPAEVQRVLGS